MALLPQELTGSQKGGGVLELPTHNIAPLVQVQREVTVGPDPLGKERVHNCLRGGADGQGLGQVRGTTTSHPCHLRSETFNVFLLRIECALAGKHREIRVLSAPLLELTVKEGLNLLPYAIGPGAQDVTAGDI